MEEAPWGVLPDVSDRLSFMNKFFNSSPKNISDLFGDVIAPPSPPYNPHGQNMNYLDLFDSPMWNFGNSSNMPSAVSGEGSQATLADHYPSQTITTGGESITNSLIEISEKRGPSVSLTDHQMYEAKSASNSVDDPLHILRAEAEAGLNPLAEIFGRRSTILLEDPLHILPASNHPSQLYRAGGSVSNPPDDHPMPIVGAGGESSINPLAVIFERSSTILPKELQILPAENHSLKLYEAGGSVSNALDDHPIPIFESGGESSINPLAEIFGERKNAVLLGDHSSLDDHPQHISRAEGGLSLGRNLNHNPENFRNKDMLPPLLMDQISRQLIHSNCIDCHVLKEVFYYNHKFFIKLEIHGKWGVICHGIQECRAIVLDNYDARSEPIYERFDFRSQSLNEVKHFLIHYCEALKAEGYIRQPDPVQSLLQDLYVEMEDENEWEEVLSYPEEFIFEEFDIEDFDPPNSKARKHRHVEKASSSKGKGKMRGRPPKRPRFSHAEQSELERAARMKERAANMRQRAANMKLDDLRAYFHLSIEEAAEKLRFSIAMVKKLCHKFGICRWPNRKQLKAISKEISTLQPLLLSYRKGTRDYIAARIASLEKERAVLFHHS